MKKKIDVFEYTGQILNGVKSGVLITSKSDERVNSMQFPGECLELNGENLFLLL